MKIVKVIWCYLIVGASIALSLTRLWVGEFGGVRFLIAYLLVAVGVPVATAILLIKEGREMDRQAAAVRERAAEPMSHRVSRTCGTSTDTKTVNDIVLLDRERKGSNSRLVQTPETNLRVKELQMQAYCLKCRKKVEIKNPKAIIMKNKRPATQGVCPLCGTKVFRIGKA